MVTWRLIRACTAAANRAPTISATSARQAGIRPRRDHERVGRRVRCPVLHAVDQVDEAVRRAEPGHGSSGWWCSTPRHAHAWVKRGQ